METTSPKFFCFVLMPFTADFNDIYTYGIKESCKDADAYCERVDEQIFQERILDRIYNQISKADLIIADMTGRNPNVFYEVGYAHALNKPTILLTQNSEDIPFDLKHFPHIIYEKQIKIIRDELTKRILWFKNNEESSHKLSQNAIEILLMIIVYHQILLYTSMKKGIILIFHLQFTITRRSLINQANFK